MVYETKGLSLEQIDELFSVVQQARKSKSFTPHVSFQDVEASGKNGFTLREIESASVDAPAACNSV